MEVCHQELSQPVWWWPSDCKNHRRPLPPEGLVGFSGISTWNYKGGESLNSVFQTHQVSRKDEMDGMISTPLDAGWEWGSLSGCWVAFWEYGTRGQRFGKERVLNMVRQGWEGCLVHGRSTQGAILFLLWFEKAILVWRVSACLIFPPKLKVWGECFRKSSGN